MIHVDKPNIEDIRTRLNELTKKLKAHQFNRDCQYCSARIYFDCFDLKELGPRGTGIRCPVCQSIRDISIWDLIWDDKYFRSNYEEYERSVIHYNTLMKLKQPSVWERIKSWFKKYEPSQDL